ncbi:unnamed protein product [Coffea canephora]|uniref:Uncharacterized protein n=1 Tax=Coffea canephora TaxID=49390 RepID=A0A068UAF9_COFCA|nr:unnamed protein product [Coffea canephora]
MECQIHSSGPQLTCRTSPRHKPNYSSSSLVLPKSRIRKTTVVASQKNLDRQQPIPAPQLTESKLPRRDVYNIKFETLASCKLGISVYPDFEYNAEEGSGSGMGTNRNTDSNESDGDIFVDFDLNTLYIPPLTTATTRFMGLPLPPFLRIDIAPEILRGSINQETGKVELEFKASFWFSVGKLYKAPPLLVGTVLTSEESEGTIRSGRGERLNGGGRCRLVGVAMVQPIDDFFMDSFLGLPTECFAELNAIISVSTK